MRSLPGLSKPISEEMAIKIVLGLVAHHKVPFSLSAYAPDGFAWNGKRFAFRFTAASDVLHHFAHYLVASGDRRKLPEFGLGPGFDTGKDDKAKDAAIITGYDAQREEGKASCLGILMERELGMNWKNTYKEHGWNESYGLTNFEDVVDQLFALGLIRVGYKVEALRNFKRMAA